MICIKVCCDWGEEVNLHLPKVLFAYKFTHLYHKKAKPYAVYGTVMQTCTPSCIRSCPKCVPCLWFSKERTCFFLFGRGKGCPLSWASIEPTCINCAHSKKNTKTEKKNFDQLHPESFTYKKVGVTSSWHPVRDLPVTIGTSQGNASSLHGRKKTREKERGFGLIWLGRAQVVFYVSVGLGHIQFGSRFDSVQA